MKRAIRRLLGCLCAVQLGWLILAVVPVGTASVATITASRSQSARALIAFKKEFTNTIAPMLHVRNYPQTVKNGVTSTGSYNWSGYANTSTTSGEFTKVQASWKVPTLAACTKEDRITAVWVGLDGFNTSTVEQDGTSEQCFEGNAYYYSWYELYPAGTVEVGTTVKPGDAITASVTRTGTSYELDLTDATTSGNSFTESGTCSTCLNQSAEFVVERPAYASTGIVPLAQYSAGPTFTKASETAGGTRDTISTGPTPYEIEMVDSTDSYALNVPTALNALGNGFTTAWKDSY